MQVTLSTNKHNLATSQYLGFDFLSAVTFANNAIVARSDGLFSVSGSTDAGTDISTVIKLPVMDFSTANQKRIRSGHLSYASNGDITVTITLDGADTYTQTLPSTKGMYGSSRILGNRDCSGRSVAVEIRNTTGCIVQLFGLELFLVSYSRRTK